MQEKTLEELLLSPIQFCQCKECKNYYKVFGKVKRV